MEYISLLIKPVSGLCNMRCQYCFYADVVINRNNKNYGIMTAETAERLIQLAFKEAEPGNAVSFAFQGGEPTLAGLQFFRNFVKMVAQLQKKGVQVSYAMQTNGMSIDGNWVDFFRENQFLVGLSIDGSKDVHDRNRVDTSGRGSWNRVVRSWKLLQQGRVETNVLCVVSNACSRSPQKVYAALKKIGAHYLQFIPCLDPLEGLRGSYSYSLKPVRYKTFLCTLFDQWYQDWKAGQYVSIRQFEDYVRLFMGLPADTCATSGRCGNYFVVESDGSLYPCDFYVLDEWRLGSIYDDISFAQLSNSDVAKRFYDRGHSKPPECASCQWGRFCRGGCPRDWYTEDAVQHNYFCTVFRGFLSYAAPRLEEIAIAEILARRNADWR